MNTSNIEQLHPLRYVIMHITVVLSAFGMGMLDRLTRHD